MVVKRNNEWRRWSSAWGESDELDVFHCFSSPPPTHATDPDFFLGQSKPSYGGECSFWDWSFQPPASPWRHTGCVDKADSSIIVPDAVQGFWARSVLIVSLPQLMLHLGNESTAAEIYDQWLQAPVILRTAARGGKGAGMMRRRNQPMVVQESKPRPPPFPPPATLTGSSGS
jgi:hypothetical protein